MKLNQSKIEKVIVRWKKQLLRFKLYNIIDLSDNTDNAVLKLTSTDLS